VSSNIDPVTYDDVMAKDEVNEYELDNAYEPLNTGLVLVKIEPVI
jgi:hypothetical protein